MKDHFGLFATTCICLDFGQKVLFFCGILGCKYLEIGM